MSADVLLLGGSSQVGRALRRLAGRGGLRLHAPARAMLDVTDAAAVRRAVAGHRWACVVNAAAFTAVDAAETRSAEAWRLNALAPAVLAAATAAAGIPLVQLSTDYVFDGTSPRPYQPRDPVRPLNVYGASKAGGEQAVRAGNARHVIVRTAWLVSPHRANFLKTILRLANERGVLRVVDDQVGCPTSAADLAEALAAIAARLAADPDAPCGTYHCVNAGAATRHAFARAIVAGAAARGARFVPVEPISTADLAAGARRPANVRLSTHTLTRDFGISLRPWRAALPAILDELIGPVEAVKASA